MSLVLSISDFFIYKTAQANKSVHGKNYLLEIIYLYLKPTSALCKMG